VLFSRQGENWGEHPQPPALLYLAVSHLECAEVNTTGKTHEQIDLFGVMGPGTKSHMTFLLVKREICDVNGARGLEDGMGEPEDIAISVYNGQSFALLYLHVSAARRKQ